MTFKKIKSTVMLVCNTIIVSALVATLAQANSSQTLDKTARIIADDVAARVDVEYFLYSPELYPQEFCMAQNIYFEAGIDNHAGMAAVADVVLNRTINAFYPNTVCEVVYQGYKHASGAMKRNKCQFSWYCDGKSDKVPAGSENWVRAQMVAWEMMHNDHFRGITEGATHYHATYVTPNWRNDRGMDLIGRIGAHIFYRWN